MSTRRLTAGILADDLFQILRRRARERDVPFKAVVNEAIRVGLEGGRDGKRKPYRMNPGRARLRPDIDYSKGMEIAGALEDEEIIRKLQQAR
jgi:hypothetical protein